MLCRKTTESVGKRQNLSENDSAVIFSFFNSVFYQIILRCTTITQVFGLSLFNTKRKPHKLSTDALPHILYVDDEENNLSAFQAAFRRYFTIFTAISATEARKILEENNIHVLISDQKMPGTPGVELLEQALQKYPNQVRILLTAYSDFEILKQAVNNGYIFKYIVKPWKDEEMRVIIAEAYDLYVKNMEKKELIKKAEEKKLYLEEEIRKLEEILRVKKEEIDKFIDNS